MICLFMVYVIMSNLKNTLFITINQSDSKNRYSHALKKRSQSNEFNNGVSQSTVFNLSNRSGNNNLLIQSP